MYLILLETDQERDRFRTIYEKNYLKMYHVALGILKQQADAENAVHEAFLALAENFGKYSYLPDGKMTGLCVSIAKNKAIDMLRKIKHYTKAELEDLILYDERTEVNPEEAQQTSEESQVIRQAMQEISEVLREALILKYYYGMGNQEIAKIQGVSKKAVEMRLYRGKQKLKMILDAFYQSGH